MKIIVTTSDAYLHILPIFCYLFNSNWDSRIQVEIVGYKRPDFEMPSNFSFYSLGTQTNNKKDFSNDLRKYFEKQDKFFIWLMEDSFIRKIDNKALETSISLISKYNQIGRINLTTEVLKQNNLFLEDLGEYRLFENTQTANYRLSTQPSIWNREFLLNYLTPNLSPWEFETQESTHDGYRIVGLNKNSIYHNEGVRKFDLHKYNLEGISDLQLEQMKKLSIL